MDHSKRTCNFCNAAISEIRDKTCISSLPQLLEFGNNFISFVCILYWIYFIFITSLIIGTLNVIQYDI